MRLSGGGSLLASGRPLGAALLDLLSSGALGCGLPAGLRDGGGVPEGWRSLPR